MRRFSFPIAPALTGFTAALTLTLSCGGTGPLLCITGTSTACTCTNGLMGAQSCQADGTFGACQCGGSTVCNASNCAGCCDATGACQSGTSFSACGRSGNLCVACGSSQMCVNAVCRSPENGNKPDGGSCDNCAANQLCTQNGCATAKRVFVTKTRYNGNLGGLVGADQKCNTAAEAAGLGGTWKAWLSDSNTNAIDRIAEVGPWYDIVPNETWVNQKVFNNKAGLATTPLAGIQNNEDGSFNSSGTSVWTGTSVGGVASANHCLSWTSTSSIAVYGVAGKVNNGWTSYSTNSCSDTASLYCIEQ